VVRRDVEKDAGYQIGWAIFPAVALHGMFDFVLFSFDMMEYVWTVHTASSSTYPPNHRTYAPSTTDDLFAAPDDAHVKKYHETIPQQLLGFSLGAAIAIFGVLYYVNEAGKQRHRLQALEMTTAQVPSMATMVFFA
jgi:hypothetical protein